MADQWSITFNGVTLMTASEGMYKPPVLGVFPRRIVVEELALAGGAIVKDGGFGPAKHSLSMTFMLVGGASAVDAVQDRFQGAFTASAGTLAVPDRAARPNCVMTAVEMGDPMSCLIPTPLGQPSTALSPGYTFDVKVDFTQLRP